MPREGADQPKIKGALGSLMPREGADQPNLKEALNFMMS